MIKIALLNGSPKTKNSVTELLIKELQEQLRDCEVKEFSLRTPQLKNAQEIINHDVLVICFPLYVDGVPSHLLSCLEELRAKLVRQKADIKVYAISNAGFYEGHQNRHALRMIKNWCTKCGLTWGQGIGIGGGGMIHSIQNVPNGKGPKKNISMALNALASNILSGSGSENIYVNGGIPRFLYKLAGEMGWRQTGKANGLKTRELFTRR